MWSFLLHAEAALLTGSLHGPIDMNLIFSYRGKEAASKHLRLLKRRLENQGRLPESEYLLQF